jgi:hypothetical protein
MATMTRKARKLAGETIERIYSKYFNGVQVSVLDTPKIYQAAERVYEGTIGLGIDPELREQQIRFAMAEVVAQVRKN